jgi:spore coat protein CotH
VGEAEGQLVARRARGDSRAAAVDGPVGRDAGRKPWLVHLDEFVDDQDHDGVSEFVVRSNNSETALNEAVSVGLLAEAGLLTQRATYVRFTVNDRPVALRLVLENMEQEWADANLPDDALLYKADASGDYSYRGDDPTAYEEAWDQEAGDDDLEPLIDLLDFVNNSDDATFAAEIGDHLDLDAFAEYMAMEDLLQNFDDISGPGNNSVLAFDPATEQFTVVAWDLALLRGVGQVARDSPAVRTVGAGRRPREVDPSRCHRRQVQAVAGQGEPALVDRLAGLDDYTTRYDAATRLTSELSGGDGGILVNSWTCCW